MEDYYQRWKAKNPNYFKEYHEKNREKMNNYHKDWIKENSESIKEYQKEYHKEYYKTHKIKKGDRIQKELDKLKIKAEEFKKSLVAFI
jgi:hypothetical protein